MFRFLEDQLAIVNIHCPQFEHLTDPHPTAGHQFEHDPVPRIFHPKNDLVNNIFSQHGPWHFLWGLEDFLEHRCLAWVFKVWLECVFDEIEKRFQIGIAELFSGLFGAVGEIDKKRQDFIGGDGIQFSFSELGFNGLETYS